MYLKWWVLVKWALGLPVDPVGDPYGHWVSLGIDPMDLEIAVEHARDQVLTGTCGPGRSGLAEWAHTGGQFRGAGPPPWPAVRLLISLILDEPSPLGPPSWIFHGDPIATRWVTSRPK